MSYHISSFCSYISLQSDPPEIVQLLHCHIIILNADISCLFIVKSANTTQMEVLKLLRALSKCVLIPVP
jgi:hypothetical protein